MSVLQQPVFESVQPGDSVTLNCTIHIETCVGQHSVYWFRHGSGESHPGIIYTHGDRSDQCEKIPDAGSPTQSCVYNLPKRNLSLSDAGTYYCAVASYGCKEDHLPFMYFLGVALGLCVILIIVLTCVFYKMSKCTGTHPQPSAPAVPSHDNQKPKAGRQRSAMERDTVYSGDFNGTNRLNVKRGVDSFNLTISKTQLGDSATYYCGAIEVGKVKFGQGAVLIVKDLESNSMSVLQQPVSESVQPGDSVTLNCTIHTETCVGEHSVYWFRHGSGESRPGIIYTHGERSDQCAKSPEAGSPTQSCVYNLPKKKLSLSDAGTYYCAVASWGDTVWERDQAGHSRADPLLLEYCLGVALAFSLILIIVLACIMYKMNQRKCLQCRGPVSMTTCPSVSSTDAGAQDADNLHYVALNLRNKKNRSGRQRSQMEEETVYAGIRQTVGHIQPMLEDSVIVALLSMKATWNCISPGTKQTLERSFNSYQPSISCEEDDNFKDDHTVSDISTSCRDRKATFYHEFKDNPRFSVENGQENNHLRISDMQLSDSGTYYCGSAYGNKVEFGEGAILIVKGSGSRNMYVLQQPVSESVQPGDY
ncbi:unnamed protein product, partial [Coregonus sp. 'balchen']